MDADALRAIAAGDEPLERRARRCADAIRATIRCRWVGIYALEADEVVNLAWSGPGAPAYPRFPVGAGLTGAAIAARATVVADDVAADPRYLEALATTGSEMIVPVLAGGAVAGTLDLESDRTGAFAADDRAAAERMAEALAGLFGRG